VSAALMSTLEIHGPLTPLSDHRSPITALQPQTTLEGTKSTGTCVRLLSRIRGPRLLFLFMCASPGQCSVNESITVAEAATSGARLHSDLGSLSSPPGRPFLSALPHRTRLTRVCFC
jgi:hypothetical protein